MTASRRPPSASLPSLLAIGVACAGGACSAPTPPVPETPAYETPQAPSPAVATTADATAREAMPDPVPAPDVAAIGEPPPATTPGPAEDPQTEAIEPMQPPTSGAPPTPPEPPAQPADDVASATLTVTMLSRGKGVPDEARAAYNDIRALLERQASTDIVTGLRTQRIGLEGETRLCAEFRSAQDAQTALDAIRRRAGGVDLLDISTAPCPSPKDSKP